MFGEKSTEYSRKQGKDVSVWKSDKYEQTKKTATEIIKKYDGITEADFWILMNETKSGKMAYTGLIISHNGCLKINDTLKQKFDPESITIDKDGYNNSLVYTYCNKEQGIYEVGEVSRDNLKNAGYPYAMAFKRCFDRVVLKLSKIAYNGIYSESEADEFREVPDETRTEEKKFEQEVKNGLAKKLTKTEQKTFRQFIADKGIEEQKVIAAVGKPVEEWTGNEKQIAWNYIKGIDNEQ